MLVGYLLFKQKTAYEMRISDWSSDVCSSDLEKEVRAASVALEGVQQEAVAGQRTVLDILNAEQDVSDAQVLLAQARHDLALARFDVLAAIGRLSARGLDLDVELYDPRAHYNEVRNRWWGLGESVQP